MVREALGPYPYPQEHARRWPSLLVELLNPTGTTAGFDCLVSRANVPAVDASDLVVVMQFSRAREAVMTTLGTLCLCSAAQVGGHSSGLSIDLAAHCRVRRT